MRRRRVSNRSRRRGNDLNPRVPKVRSPEIRRPRTYTANNNDKLVRDLPEGEQSLYRRARGDIDRKFRR